MHVPSGCSGHMWSAPISQKPDILSFHNLLVYSFMADPEEWGWHAVQNTVLKKWLYVSLKYWWSNWPLSRFNWFLREVVCTAFCEIRWNLKYKILARPLLWEYLGSAHICPCYKQLLASADNLCKHSGHISGTTIRHSWTGFKQRFWRSDSVPERSIWKINFE